MLLLVFPSTALAQAAKDAEVRDLDDDVSERKSRLARELSEPTLRTGPVTVSVLAATRLAPERRDVMGLVAVGFPTERAVGTRGAPASRPLFLVPTDVELARCVEASLRRSAVSIRSLEHLVRRARASALLPEARVRILRTSAISARVDTTPLDEQRAVTGEGTDLWFEGRLTFRLDRLLFAEEEVSFERMRLERQEHRNRVMSRVVDLYYGQKRAIAEAVHAGDGTEAQTLHRIRAEEMQAELDVLSGGCRLTQTPPLDTKGPHHAERSTREGVGSPKAPIGAKGASLTSPN